MAGLPEDKQQIFMELLNQHIEATKELDAYNGENPVLTDVLCEAANYSLDAVLSMVQFHATTEVIQTLRRITKKGGEDASRR